MADRTIFVAGYGFTTVIASFIAGIGGVVVYARVHGLSGADPTEVTAWFQDPAVLVWLQIGAALPILGLLLGLCYGLRRFVDRRAFRSLGLSAPRTGWAFTIVVGFLLGALPILASLGAGLALEGYAFSGTSYSAATLVLAPTFLVMAFNEEIACRGYMLQNFVDDGRPWLGILVSSIVFWLFHALNPAVWSTPFASINLFGAGVVLALAYLASGNLWFPTILHWAWNLVQGVVFQLPVSGLEIDGYFDFALEKQSIAWLTGGAFGPEGGAAVTIAIVPLLAGLYVWWRRAPSP